MRMSIKLDSATASEARDFIVAYQVTRDKTLAVGLHKKPTVDIMGDGFGVETPPIEPERAVQVMAEFALRLEGRS